MISDTGLRTNLFAKAMRGTGRGSGTYIFEPLPPARARSAGLADSNST